jgi:hypothetical protein
MFGIFNFLCTASLIESSQSADVTLAIAAAGGVVVGIVIALTVFFAGDPNGSRKSALSTTTFFSPLAGATVGVLVVLLRDTGIGQPAATFMLQCVGLGILGSLLTAVISLFVIRRLYVYMIGRPDSSVEDAKRWASRSGRLRF